MTELTVFVASPSDVVEERHLLAEVIAELNRTWSRNLKVRLDLIAYESHAVPGIGVDAQDVINATVEQDYDIFIGIMWARFGTPTARAQSGTAEEFERALARHRNNPGNVKLMFYFKDDPIAPSALDVEQFSRVVAFRRRLEREGLLYWSFTGSFESYVRLHLSRQIQDLMSVSPGSSAETAIEEREALSRVEEEDVVEELGILDAFDEFMRDLSEVGASRQRVLAAIADLGSHFQPAESSISDLQSLKKITSRAAEGLEDFVRRADVEIPIMSDRFESAIQRLTTAMALASEFMSPDQIYPATLRDTLNVLVRTLERDEVGVTSFRDILIASPRISAQLNRAKRRGAEILASLARVFNSQRKLLDQLIASSPASKEGIEPPLRHEPVKARPVGLAAGEFVVPDDFDAPLPEEVLDSFEGK